MWASRLHKHEPLFQTHLREDRPWRPSIQTVIICTLCITPYSQSFVMSLFMPQVILSRTAYATSFDVHKTVFPLFRLERVPLRFFFFSKSTSEGMSQLLCQHWICLRVYPEPSAHTIAHFSLAHTLSACTVLACGQDRNTRQGFECTAVHWVHNLACFSDKCVISLEFICAKSPLGEKKQLLNTTCSHSMQGWLSAFPLPDGPHMHLPAVTLNIFLTS